MGEFTTPYQDPTYNAQATKKTSGLAITSLIFGILGLPATFACCPALFGALAVLLGLIGVGVMGEKKGKGLAWTGVILGVVAIVLQFAVVPKLPYVQAIRQGFKLVMAGPADAMTAGFAGDTAGFKAEFTGAGASATEAEVQAFIGGLRTEYGEFVSCALDQSGGNPSPAPGQAQAVLPYVFTFSNGQASGEVEIIFADQATGKIVMKFSTITVETEAGDLTYPAPASP
jgi:hypothetical protein